MTEVTPPKPRLLITGGTGLLATNWACAMRSNWDVVLGTHHHTVALEGVRSSQIDLANSSTFGAALDRLEPDLVVHAAGLTDVDKCDADPVLAEHANAGLARIVAEATGVRSIRLIHVSTDHLFQGDRALVSEEEPPQPLNEYGRSKWLAEQWVLQAHAGALVVRTNFFGWGHTTRRSFSDWVLSTLRANQPLSAFGDVHFTPSLADRVAQWGHALSAAGAAGVFHVCGDERVSKYDFACRLATMAALPVDLIRETRIEDAGLKAPRPRDMSLSTEKARRVLRVPATRLDDDLRTLLDQELSGRRAELLRAVST